MYFLLILAVFANLNGQVFGKDVFEIGVLFEAGCAGARGYIIDFLIPMFDQFSKDGKHKKTESHIFISN